MPGGALMRTIPSKRVSRRSAARVSSAAQSAMRLAGSSKVSPNAVSRAPSTLREKRVSPSIDSSSANRRLTVGCATERRRAAALRLPVSATAKKSRASSHDISTICMVAYTFAH